jgi:hypothetical protein
MSNNQNDFEIGDLILFSNGIYYISNIGYKGNQQVIEYSFIGSDGKLSREELQAKDFNNTWNMKPTLHKLKVGDTFASKNYIILVEDVDLKNHLVSYTTSNKTEKTFVDKESLLIFCRVLVDGDYIYQGNTSDTTTSSSNLNDVEEIERELRMYDIISVSNKMYYIKGFVGKGSMDNYQVKYIKEKDGVLVEGTFFIDDIDTHWDIDTYWETKPDFYEMSKGDVFSNSEGDRITINEVSKRVRTQKPTNIQTWVKYTLVKDGKSEDSESIITNILNYMLLNKYNIELEASTPSVPTSTEDVDTTPLNLEGDFIGEFVNKNAKNLLELEKNNRPLFDVVEMTLNLLSEKFGSGQNVAEKVDVVIDNADEIINAVQEKDPNLIGLTEIEVLSNEGSPSIKGKKYTSWTEFNEALKPLLEVGVGGYNKVRFKATFDDGNKIEDRVDVGENSFNPFENKVGEYVDRPFMFNDTLYEDLDKYQWDDEIIVSESSDSELVSVSKEDIENEISALEISLMLEEDENKVKEINEKIEALKISLELI